MAARTVLYDADCGVCAALARWVARVGRDVAVAPIHGPVGAVLLRDLAADDRLAGMHVVDRLGRRLTGGDAVPAVLRALPGGTLLALVAGAFPHVTTAGYDAFAANRRRISTAVGLDACRTPD
jgi:predicted DCC family thiol-disulfide oxidoreductase YuxK